MIRYKGIELVAQREISILNWFMDGKYPCQKANRTLCCPSVDSTEFDMLEKFEKVFADKILHHFQQKQCVCMFSLLFVSTSTIEEHFQSP